MKPKTEEKRKTGSKSASIWKRLGFRQRADRELVEPKDSDKYRFLWFQCTNKHLSPNICKLAHVLGEERFVCCYWPACSSTFQELSKSDEADDFIILRPDEATKATLRFTRRGIVVPTTEASIPVTQAANQVSATIGRSAQSDSRPRKCSRGHIFRKYVKQTAIDRSYSVLSCPVCFDPIRRIKADAKSRSSR